jgi:hypothetical protein
VLLCLYAPGAFSGVSPALSMSASWACAHG